MQSFKNISKKYFNEYIEIFMMLNMKKMKLSKDYATMQCIISGLRRKLIEFSNVSIALMKLSK